MLQQHVSPCSLGPACLIDRPSLACLCACFRQTTWALGLDQLYGSRNGLFSSSLWRLAGLRSAAPAGPARHSGGEASPGCCPPRPAAPARHPHHSAAPGADWVIEFRITTAESVCNVTLCGLCNQNCVRCAPPFNPHRSLGRLWSHPPWLAMLCMRRQLLL